MAYDYEQAVREDVRAWIEENEDYIAERAPFRDRDDYREWLDERLRIEDSVTGNASGSYWCNAWNAQECLLGNGDLMRDVVSEYGLDAATVAEHLTDWEWWDVSIRCLLLDLGSVLCDIAEEAPAEWFEEDGTA